MKSTRQSFFAQFTIAVLAAAISLTRFTSATAEDESERASPQLPDAADKAIEAYRNQEFYHARATVNAPNLKIRYELAVDRPTGRLRWEQSTQNADGTTADKLLLVSDGEKIRARYKGINTKNNRHFEMDAPDPLTYAALREILPFVADPHPAIAPELILLTSKNPIEALADGEKATVTEEKDDGSRTIIVETDNVSVKLRLDEESGLFKASTLEFEQGPVWSQKITRLESGEAGDLFAFDTEGSKAIDSIRDLVRGQRRTRPAHALEGKEAPDFTVSQLDGEEVALSKVDADVIVLDFWATWCGPCRKGLPGLQRIHEWAEENDKSVAIYCVNLKEEPQMIRPFWKERKLSMPVLLDSEGEIGDRYEVKGIPQTVLIAGGRVEKVHVGGTPNQDRTIQKKIEQLLE